MIVVELASVLAGPDVGMFFAELGAKVIKIENKKTAGDVTRKWKTPNEVDNKENISAYFSSVNWNKEHHLLDLTDSQSIQYVYSLIKEATIVIANFKPGDDKKLKIDEKTVRNINPNIIYGEINGYGRADDRVAYDVVLQAETGFMAMNGTPESGPLKMPIALIDVLAAHQLKEGLLVALLNKQKTGKGAFVEVSLYDAALASLKNQATNWLMNGENSKLQGSAHPNIAPYGDSFITKDNKQIVLAVGSDAQFKAMLKVINADILLTNLNFLTNQKRVENRELLNENLQEYFYKIELSYVVDKFNLHHIPFGQVKNLEEVFKNPKANRLVLEEKIGSITTKRVKTAVFKLTKS